MRIRGEVFIPEATSDGTVGALGRRHIFEMLLALVIPPSLAIATLISMLGCLESVESFRAFRGFAQALVLLNVTGAVLLSAVILLDLRAVEQLSARSAAEVRLALYVSALVSLAFLVAGATAQAVRDDSSDGGAIVMFICLPTLMVCAPLLWYSARAIQRGSLRPWLLAGFVMATFGAEWQCQTENRSGTEERALMLHSLLVALAVTIRLCVWGATEYRTAEGAGT